MGTHPEGNDPGRDLTVPLLAGVWLNAGPVQTPIETLLLEMVAPSQPNPILQRSVIEDLHYAVKRLEVVLEYMDLREVGADAEGEIPLVLAAPRSDRDPWREALLLPGGDCPIGFVLNTRDRGRVALVHEVFAGFSPIQKDLVRRSAGLAARGQGHDAIVAGLAGGPEGIRRHAELMADARRQVQSLDPSVLFSPDYEIRVQLGSLAQTTRNLLLEGLRGENVFILPVTLFEGKANYGDIEFVIYLDFFMRHGVRTRIVGTAHQHQTLGRLLGLVLFGLFDPGAPEQPSLERLRADFGVPDRETYEFLRAAYETYGVRRGSDPAGPVLDVGEYVDFIRLGGEETAIPIRRSGAEGEAAFLGKVWVRSRGWDGFDVRIEQADGRSTARRMKVRPPRSRNATIPEALCRPIRFATDRPRFGVTVLGTSHGFDPVGDLTSFVVWINGRGILVDPSPEALVYLEQIGVAPADVPFVFLTHIHADHDGGLLEKVLSGSRTTLIASDVVFRAFVEKVRLVTGHDFAREGLVSYVAANPGTPIPIEVGGETAVLESRWNLHPIPTNGFKIHFGDRTFGYAGDTQYDPALIDGLRDRGKLSAAQHANLLSFFWTPDGAPGVDLLFHEAGGPPIHTSLERLQALPAAVTARTFLVHVADKDVPPGSIPGKPPLFSTHVLLPPTDPSRHRILLETMRLVSYLYDIPSDTLEALLRGATVRDYAPDEVIIRKGSVPKQEPLYFYVLADGEVAIKDGRRLITKLGKGTTYGEWGISHQRGFRVADVVAARPCRCIQLGEAQYWWLVAKHPVIQDRIAKIRSLLPRIEIAQARMRLKAAADPLTRRSLIAEMTPGQLAGFAIFSEVRTFQRGQAVVVEGAEADGFYVLLSGHLTVHADGRALAELSEGDVFGEMGVLEGGTRQATVSVASADVEVLFMSAYNFQRLLEAMPVFSWEVREIAAHRRELSRQAAPASPAPPWRREFTP